MAPGVGIVLWLAASAAVADYQPPRTAAGRPDLEGLWTTNTLTPFARPEELKSLVLTDSEAAEYEKKHRGKPPPIPDDMIGAVDSEWWETDVPLVRVRGRARSSWIVSPADGQLPLTSAAKSAGKARRERFKATFDHPEDRPDGERCLPGPNAPLESGAYNSGFKLVQTADAVVIVTEWLNGARIIPVGKTAQPAEPRSRGGQSVGRWEGDTLVVETSRFHPDVVRAPDGDTAADMRVIERITRISPNALHYGFMIWNPSSLTQPIQGETVFSATAQPIFEYACHEGNYSLPNVLAGGREQDRAKATAAAAP
jgi:hypothetical protein